MESKTELLPLSLSIIVQGLMDDPHNKSTFSVEVIHFSQHPSQGVNKRKKEEEKKRLRLTKTIPKHAETSAAWKEE